MTDKAEQDRWERENEEDIIGRFLDDEEAIGKIITDFLKSQNPYRTYGLGGEISTLFKDSKDTQYAEYLDTEESDHMKEGCSFSKGDR